MVSVIFLRLLLDGVAGFKFLLQGGPSDCLAVIRAHWKFYSWIFTGQLKRPAATKKNNHSTIYSGVIVWDYYISKKRKFSDLVSLSGPTLKTMKIICVGRNYAEHAKN